jgi:hypothetical protein
VYIIVTLQYVGVFIFTLLPLYPRVRWVDGGPYTIREHAGCALRTALNLLEKLSHNFNRQMKGQMFEQDNKLRVALGRGICGPNEQLQFFTMSLLTVFC